MLDGFMQWLNALRNIANTETTVEGLQGEIGRIEGQLASMEQMWTAHSEEIIRTLQQRDERNSEEIERLWNTIDLIIDVLEVLVSLQQTEAARKRVKRLIARLKNNRTRMVNRQGAA